MYISLSDFKTKYDISSNDDDVFLTTQLQLLSDACDGYLNRIIESTTHTQTFYSSDFKNKGYYKKALKMFHYPIISIASVNQIEIDQDHNDTITSLVAAEYRASNEDGFIKRICFGSEKSWFFDMSDYSRVEITYTAGYAVVPTVLQEVVSTLVKERYDKKLAGVDINFGNNVQRVSIPGVMSLDFDYTLSSNERSSAYGMILGDWANVLDAYRSERTMIGSDISSYVS